MFNKKKKHWYNQKPMYKKVASDNPQEKGPDGIAGKEAIQKEAPAGDVPVKDVMQSDVPAGEAPAGNVQAEEVPAGVAPPEKQAPGPAAESAASAGEVTCMICNMPIRNHYTAIRRKVPEGLSHFDCVLRELSRENSPKLGKFKRIYYVGSGDFAIVKEFFDKRGHLKSYEILEKINYENNEA